ncbi:MAG TPA: hypothetical protein H9902_15045 [Candidatus Stackebrandtia faecavium]|nr:hypothetical protein [Candidatus Stackebrandtia faecavium]
MEHDDYEYAPLRFHPQVDTESAQEHLSVAALFSGWELASVKRFADGTRAVTVRRKCGLRPNPGLSI